MLKAKLAFSLFEESSKVGEKRAEIRLMEEIIKYMLNGNEQVID